MVFLGIIIALVILFLMFLLFTDRYIAFRDGSISVEKEISVEKCKEERGRIVNNLMERGCWENETNLGSIDESNDQLACPCICCVPKE